MRAYIASHFFNDAMFHWTEALASYLEEHTDLTLYVPQRNDDINDKATNDATITAVGIAEADTMELKKADLLIACIDGLTIDDGVAGEIMGFGIMAELEEEYAIEGRRPRRILGIYTDMRAEGTGDNRLYRNQMIVGKIQQHGKVLVAYPGKDVFPKVVAAVEELIAEMKDAH